MKIWVIEICNKCQDRITDDGWCFECEHSCNDHHGVTVMEVGKIKGATLSRTPPIKKVGK